MPDTDEIGTSDDVAKTEPGVDTNKPVDSPPVVLTLAQKINKARNSLLVTLQNQLETCLADKLIPQKQGAPFINFADDPGQIAAIKKVINALYHAEEALKIWEHTDNSTLWAKTKSAPKHAKALIQVYKSLASLNDATPEIQSLIAENYSLIEPVFTATYDAIKNSGWAEQFVEMEVTEQASYIINQGTELIGPVTTGTETKPNPLLDALSKFSRVMNFAADPKKSQLTPQEKQERADLVMALLKDLEGNPFLQKLSLTSLNESKAINDLLEWLKTIQEDDFEFTMDSMQKYTSWANHYLGQLITSIDQFERQNYLKSGLLSNALCESADRIANEINKQLSESSFGIDDRLQTIDSFAPVREQMIEASQVEHLQAISVARNNMASISRFFTILENYQGKSFSDITEADRIELRQLYPDIQIALAHSNLDLENKLTGILNSVGPTTTSWWSMATGALSKTAAAVTSIAASSFVSNAISNGEASFGVLAIGALATGAAGYLGGYYGKGDIDSLFAQEESMHHFFMEKIRTEQLKFTVAESARATLEAQAGLTTDTTLADRVLARTNHLQEQVHQPPVKDMVHPGELIAFKATSLNNLRGNITYLQELHLAEKVDSTRSSIRTLMNRHLSEADRVYFSEQPPHTINPDEPELVVHIKKLENALFNLHSSLTNFEHANNNFGVVSQAKLFIAITKAAYQLKNTVTALSPAARSALAPVISQITAYSTVLSNINSRSADMSEVGRLNQLDNTLPQELTQPVATQDDIIEVTPIEASSTEGALTEGALTEGTLTEGVATEGAPTEGALAEAEEQTQLPIAVDYAKQIAEARATLLNHLKSSLSAPLAQSLKPQSTGVPFVNFDNDPPQIAAIKRVINSMYYAESAIQIVNRMNTKSVSTIDKMVLAHQGMSAVSQVYKSVELLRDATPEVSRIIQNNYDYIVPMIKGAENLVQNTGWINQFNIQDVVKKTGSFLGRGLNLLQSNDPNASDSSTLIKMLSEVPIMLNSLSRTLDPNMIRDESKVKITQSQIDSITLVAERLFENKGNLVNFYRGAHALVSFIELAKKLNHEGNRLQKNTIEAYQQWMERDYPQFISLLDELEVRNYLKPGLLSSTIVKEIDAINHKVNEKIAAMDDPNLNSIPLSYDLSSARDENLQRIKEQIWVELLKNENQQGAARKFFGILHQYDGKSLNDIDTEDLAKLRVAFADIQESMSHINMELSNEFVTVINQLETGTMESAQEHKISIKQLLGQESLVHKFLEDQNKLHALNVEVANEAIVQLRPDVNLKEILRIDTEQRPIIQARYIINQSDHSPPKPGELKPVQSSSINSVRGIFSSVQELKLSSYVGLMKDKFTSMTKTQFSSRVQNFLIKPDSQPLHHIKESEPLIVRQIKKIENGLYHFEHALIRFEQLSQNDSLVSQIRLIMEIQNEVNQLKEVLSNSPPEIKAHYGALINQIANFSSVVQTIDYDKADTEELQDVLMRAKVEILKPAESSLPEASASTKEQQAPTEEVEQSISTAVRGLKLGAKYLHAASPQLEKARAYLSEKYSFTFAGQRAELRNFSRAQLANPEFMQNEATRLNELLNDEKLFTVENYRVIKELSKQLFRVGAQTGEIAGMLNTLVTHEYRTIKEVAYKEYLLKLSQEEDYLCLKPGTLLNQGILTVNQFFLSVALELNMSLEDKLALVDEGHFLNILLEQTQKDLEHLEMKIKLMPSSPEFEIEIAIKKDKIELLKQQIESFEARDLKDIVGTLVDEQFEVELRKILVNSFLDSPIIQQYERAIRAFYDTNKPSIMEVSDIGTELHDRLHAFDQQLVQHYMIVYQAHYRLNKFSSQLPPENQHVKDYIEGINNDLTNEQTPIEQRSQLVKSLPTNPTFVETIGSAVEGEGFLTKFKRFVERVVGSVREGLVTGANIISKYHEIKLEQQMRHIEKSLSFKAGLADMKNDRTEQVQEINSQQEQDSEVNADHDIGSKLTSG
ncbi:SdhB [Legionella bononiensis]|uniref:SdhB n=1 Tax=Legionella bononiensis TaxID=2793102 RepID=A0ABS1WCC1_9GAMM|nr:SdhB [Legionella bononiensis]MBL7478875.1 SdhB [Legionella bononiensis]MBL7527005.1 SdhB [Legionella bononiensis]MBL7562401.1 SdhB [Legionella bononiensis]